MRVLVAHNFYRSSAPSGENILVENEVGLLRDAGVTVTTLFVDSDDLARRPALLMDAAVGPVYSRSGIRGLIAAIEQHKPDLIHIHNVYPLISPYIVKVAKRYGLPIVQTVHNYRHSCLNGQHFRDGRKCLDCTGRRFPLSGVVHGCYRESRLQSAAMATGQAVHRKTWQSIDCFLALTPFMARHLQKELDLRDEQVCLRPSWAVDRVEKPTGVGNDIAFVGRLDKAKGIDVLLEAWEGSNTCRVRNLMIAGDGPLKSKVLEACARDNSIKYLGRVPPSDISLVYESALVVAVPSAWYEGFPLTIVESLSRGRPVLLPDGGSPASIATEDIAWIVEPTVLGWRAGLDSVTKEAAQEKGSNGREVFENKYSSSVAIGQLIEIYWDLIRKER